MIDYGLSENARVNILWHASSKGEESNCIGIDWLIFSLQGNLLVFEGYKTKSYYGV